MKSGKKHKKYRYKNVFTYQNREVETEQDAPPQKNIQLNSEQRN